MTISLARGFSARTLACRSANVTPSMVRYLTPRATDRIRAVRDRCRGRALACCATWCRTVRLDNGRHDDAGAGGSTPRRVMAIVGRGFTQADHDLTDARPKPEDVVGVVQKNDRRQRLQVRRRRMYRDHVLLAMEMQDYGTELLGQPGAVPTPNASLPPGR